MRSIAFLLVLTSLFLWSCSQEPPKLQKQKQIYFSLSDVPRREKEAEIRRTMESHHLATEGQAMIYLLDQTIAYLPQTEAIVSRAASQAGISFPSQDSLDRAADQIKLARELRSMREARDAIAKLEPDEGIKCSLD